MYKNEKQQHSKQHKCLFKPQKLYNYRQKMLKFSRKIASLHLLIVDDVLNLLFIKAGFIVSENRKQ